MMRCSEQIAHYPTLSAIPSEVVEPILEEIVKYKEALKACYASFEASMVNFEVGRTGGKGGHAHIQVGTAHLISTTQY